MQPLISIEKQNNLLERFFLDVDRPTFTIGSSPICNLTTTQESAIKQLPVFRWVKGNLQVQLAGDLNIEATIDDRQLNLQNLRNMGIAKPFKQFTRMEFKNSADTSGTIRFYEFTLHFAFTDRPVTAPAIQLLTWKYLRQMLRDLDWSFASLTLVIFLGTFWFGNFLYGLPTPMPETPVREPVVFRFAKISIPAEYIKAPTSSAANAAPSSGLNQGEAPGNVASQRELLSHRLDTLLGKIDDKLDLPSGGGGAPFKATQSYGQLTDQSDVRADVRANAQDSSRYQGGIKVRKLFNYQSQGVSSEKKIAAMAPTTPMANDLYPSAASAPAGSSYDQATANAVIRGAQGRIRACYESSLKSNRQLAGKVQFEFNLLPQGSPSEIRLQPAESLQDSSFLNCLNGVIAGLKFPPPQSAAAQIRFSMVFTPNTHLR